MYMLTSQGKETERGQHHAPLTPTNCHNLASSSQLLNILLRKNYFFSDTIGHDDGDYDKVDVMYTVEMEICLTMTNLFVVK